MAQDLQNKRSSASGNPLLRALLLEDENATQKEIAEILQNVNEDKAVSLLFDALLKSPHTPSRERVVAQLAKIGSKKAVELLQSIMIDDFEPEVQRVAAKALVEIGSDTAVDSLLFVLQTADEWSRRRAAIALGEFDSNRVVDALIEASKDPFIGGAAVLSLAHIGSDRATERLIEVMLDLITTTGTASMDAMEGLVRLATDQAIDGLIQAWNNPVSIHGNRLYLHLSQHKPKRLIEPLSQRLQDTTLSSETRRATAEMLGVIGTESEVPLLKAIWREDHDKDVGWSALRSAEKIALSEFEKKAERERTLEETRAFIAHEFRHVLTPINAYAKMLHENLTQSEIDKDKLSSLAVRIRKQTDTAFDLVNQYLDYSRPLSPQFLETSVNMLLALVLEEFKLQLETRQIVLRTQFDENDYFQGDKVSLVQVFRNVIANAIQAMESDKQGALDVTTASAEDSLLITIRDTGVGIKAEQLPNVFNFGFTTKFGSHGAGFGLAFSKRIVEAHNGSIVLASDGERGTTVAITLPRRQREKKDGRQHITLVDR